MDNKHIQEKDELRARFTAWLKTLLERAKIDYIRHEQLKPKTIALDMVENDLYVPEPEAAVTHDSFDFENEMLKAAFMRLSSSQKNILVLLFVEQLNADEAAQKLGCTVQHVYNLRSKAIIALRKELIGGENKDE